MLPQSPNNSTLSKLHLLDGRMEKKLKEKKIFPELCEKMLALVYTIQL